MNTNKELSYSSLSDEELLEFIETPQRKKIFGILYDRYHQKVYFKCISMVKNEQTARDLTHDIFIKIFTKINQFKGNSRLSLWIHSVAVHSCLTHIRKAKKSMGIFKDEDVSKIDNLPEDNSDLTDKMLLEVQLDELENMLANLKDEERIIMLMKYIDGMSIKEIALILNLGESAIKMKLKRTREKLYSMFVKHSKIENP